MTTRHTTNGVLWTLLATVILSSAAIATEQSSVALQEPSNEMRAKMASLHEQMATCLRSDKPVKDCRAEMMKACQQLGNDQGCPMMGMGAHRRMMRTPGSHAPEGK